MGPTQLPIKLIPNVVVRNLVYQYLQSNTTIFASPKTPQEQLPTHSYKIDPEVQLQPEDGPHIGPKHAVITLL